MKFSKLAIIAALPMIGAAIGASAGLPAAAWAQAPAEANQDAGLAVGATVYDAQGDEVGTIAQISGEVVIVDTGTNQATLGKASFAKGPNGPIVGATKAELDAMVEKARSDAAAALAAALQPGAAVRSMDGIELGTIKSIEGDNAMLDYAGKLVPLKREYFATDANGLMVRFTAQALKDAMAQ